MKKAEENNLKTQLKLYEEVCHADNMIFHIINTEASSILNSIIAPKMFFEKEQTTVVLTTDELIKIRLLLARLSNHENFKELNNYIETTYINPKKEKLKIIGMLQDGE